MPVQSLASLASAPKSASLRFAAILEWARASIDDAMDKAGVETIIAQAQQAYDAYVKPLDVPWLSEDLEGTFIDEPAKKLLREAILGFHALVHKQDA